MTKDQSLSPLEAAFLHAESARTPMHMASIAVFESAPLEDGRGNLRIDELRRLIAGRLDLVPKLRRRPRSGLLGQAPPHWDDDPGFDIANHVVERRLPAPGSEEQLLALCGEMLSVPLDRSRPLWELIFVTGLAGHRVALIEKLHHSMADGLAAAELALVLLDLSPEPAPTPGAATWHASQPASPLAAAVDDLLALARIGVRIPAWFGWTAIHPVRRAASLRPTATAIISLLKTGLIAPRTSLNVEVSGARALHVVRMDLDGARRVAHANDTTVNDVVLTVVAGGLRALLWGRGGDLPAEVTALVPVGLADGEGRDMGNRVSALFVKLPLAPEDPVEVLGVVSAETRALKKDHQERATTDALGLLDPLPQGVLSAGAHFIGHQPFFNLIVTNVPGPSFPLYAMGARMLEAFPVVPLIGNEGMAVAALSYDGSLNLGILSDPTVCPDVPVFCEGATETFRRLVDRAVHPARPSPRRAADRGGR